MSKMKELEQIATWIADSVDDTIISNTEWAIEGTSFDELEGDAYYEAQDAIAAKTVEILYNRWFTNKIQTPLDNNIK